jgi:hypothetical protein
MWVPWRRKEVPRALAEVRRERASAERQLSEAQRDVIVPLRELRERNHVADAITSLIQRRAEQERP